MFIDLLQKHVWMLEWEVRRNREEWKEGRHSWDMLYERRIKKNYEDDRMEEKDKMILSM